MNSDTTRSYLLFQRFNVVRHVIAKEMSSAERFANRNPLSSEPSPAELARKSEEALVLWLRWNDGYQKISERLFRSRDDAHALGDLLDELDQIRAAAAALSVQVLGARQTS